MVTVVVPVLFAIIRIEPVVAVPVWKVMLVMLICSVAVNENVRAPIHAATAMLTATVTAMSMIDATTGLRAFLLLLFIFLFIPPFGISMYGRGSARFKSYDSLHKIHYLYNTNTHNCKKNISTTIERT
jgi:hypothetical protein